MLKPCLGAEQVLRLFTPQTQVVIRTRRIVGPLSGVSSKAAVHIRSEHRYPILIKAGLLDQFGAYAGKYLPPGKCAIVSDNNVARIYANRVRDSLASAGFLPTLITIPGTELSKTLKQAGAICDRMIAAGLNRKSFVVGLG